MECLSFCTLALLGASRGTINGKESRACLWLGKSASSAHCSRLFTFLHWMASFQSQKMLVPESQKTTNCICLLKLAETPSRLVPTTFLFSLGGTYKVPSFIQQVFVIVYCMAGTADREDAWWRVSWRPVLTT